MRFSVATLLLLSLVACGGSVGESEKRVVVFGVDGLDPVMLQERIDRGEMPNFARLMADQGRLASLGTSWPPQSPVAWSNFITGTNPGKHGLYDFIHVDPHSYGVVSSMSHSEPVGTEVSLFGYRIPLSGGDMTLTRQFPAFWEVLSEAGVPCYVHRMPANFPLAPTEAVTFPDMGAPDLTGAASGVATLWTEDASRFSKKSGESYRVLELTSVTANSAGTLDTAYSLLYGPADGAKDTRGMEKERDEAIEAENFALANQLQAKIEVAQETHIPVTLQVDLTGAVPMLAAELDGQLAIAAEGEWSNWVPVSFGMMWGGMSAVDGWTRLLFKSAEPLEVYASPIQIDPWNPAQPISTPDSAAADLADAIGPYYTQGFPDAYKAYKAGLLDTGEFVNQSDTVFEERGRMMDYGLGQLEETGGLLFLYVGSLDMRCHMLWHAADDAHPHQEDAGEYDGVPYSEQIDRVYRQVDSMLGELLAELDTIEEATGSEIELIIMSDHGFAPMRRVMHVNDWLVQEGYLVLKDGVETTSTLALSSDGHGGYLAGTGNIDWSRSKAYSVGFNGVILNRVGREAEGIVADDEADALLAEIRAKLLALQDGGRPVLTRVLTATEAFNGPALGSAPDLQLGFNTGFGASDPSAVGGVTGSYREGIFLADNDSRWSGSHLMDPELVPGTIVTRRDLKPGTQPTLEDITATLYSLFEVSPPEGIDGKPLFE